MSFVEVYDQQMRMQAVLDNAKDVQYQLNHNELSTGAFTLPAKDPKIQHCQAHAFVRIADDPRPPMLYRIIQEPAASLIGGKERMFTLEGAEATMLDKLIFGYHQIGGTGVDTEAVLRWLLDWQEEPKRWVLGRCDFHYEFEYKFESVHLLPALFSVASCIADEYTWIFDTNVTPWTVSLVKSSTAPSCGLTYMRNMTDIQKGMDATGLVTRLYPIGYGEGVNELHIGSVNGGRAARIFAENLRAIYPGRVRALTTTTIGEVTRTRAPSVFLELAYHDNREDAAWIVSNIDAIARNLVLSLTEYFDIPFVWPQPVRTGTVQTSSGSLNIRSKPSTNSRVIASAPNGASLTITGDVDNWYVVEYGNTAGYANKAFVRE